MHKPQPHNNLKKQRLRLSKGRGRFLIGLRCCDLLNAFIKPQWNAVSPSSVELGGKVSTWPVVDLTIGKDGKVSKAVIVSKSGNKAVDDAVTSLLARLNVVPVPPQACTIRITLEIR